MTTYSQINDGREQVKLTPTEAEQIEWALDIMGDIWCSEQGAWDRDGDVYNESQLPTLVDGVYTPSTVDEINEDMKFRITTCLMEMCKDAMSYSDKEVMLSLRVQKAIKSLTKKLGWARSKPVTINPS